MKKKFKHWFKNTWEIMSLDDSKMMWISNEEWINNLKEAFEAGYNCER